ncbi:hypothetical protein [Lentzea aerocolonigenes]|uniref:hypothetical protein n=1 Tax=Lentzea aerocolonigenes TaxID=68170 RepID=UPI000A7259BF|nr:hypothetical protein [Lentzea aerocolonigenes]MCP2245416.1 hypothetical protein [Lentzea aerocolonigenes]
MILLGANTRIGGSRNPALRLTLNHDNAALTVIRYTTGRSPRLVRFNDSGHLSGI